MINLKDLLDTIKEYIKNDMSLKAYNDFIEPLKALDLVEPGVFRVQARNAYAVQWLDERVKRTFDNFLGGIPGIDTVQFVEAQ